MITYRELEKATSGKCIPLACVNDNGEAVIIEKGAGSAGIFYKLTTSQSNGWCRINTYYADGSTEETYQK